MSDLALAVCILAFMFDSLIVWAWARLDDPDR